MYAARVEDRRRQDRRRSAGDDHRGVLGDYLSGVYGRVHPDRHRDGELAAGGSFVGRYADAKVKYRGIQVGKVKDIAYSGDQAKLTLKINSDQIRYIPSNAPVRIASTTVFGAKSVEFITPEKPSGTPLRPGTTVQAQSVQLEANTLFQTLIDVLHKIDPIHLKQPIRPSPRACAVMVTISALACRD